MFENNTFPSSAADCHKQVSFNNAEELQVFTPTIDAKSSVRVHFPIEDEDQCFQNNQIEDAGQVLNKFINYAKFHGLEPYDIWQNQKPLPYILFADTIQKKIGYKFTTRQMYALKRLGQRDQLSQASFNSFNLWPKQSITKTTLLSSISQKSLLSITKKRDYSIKNVQKSQLKKEQSPFLAAKYKNTAGDKSRIRTTCDHLTKTFFKSGFIAEQNKDNKIQALREDLEMNALEKKWELVVMAGEMNKWINDSVSGSSKEEKKVPALFKVVNHVENYYSIVRVDENKQEEVIPEVVFYKKYHALKKKQPAIKQNSSIENKNQDLLLGILGMGAGKSQPNKFNKRDKELNEALLHIMRIKNILQIQHKILTQSAINV